MTMHRFPTLTSALLTIVLGVCAAGSDIAAQSQDSPLQIYWIDVEGGGATLLVTPHGQSILMDAGWARDDNRDLHRIQAALRDAGVDRIDYFLASHFHGDHVGGLPALAASVPIGQFVDHGDSVEQGSDRGRASWTAYTSAAGDKRRTITPGDKLPLTGLEFSFVLAHAETLSEPLMPLGPNPHCAGAFPGTEDLGENARSLGYLVSLGAFQFLDLGDVTVNIQHDIACPVNTLATVDVYQLPHHGDGVAPQLTWALSPSVIVINNGPHKGGGAAGFEVAAGSPGIEDVWQLHRALDTDPDFRTADALTANLSDEDACEGHWIKAEVSADGRSYSLTNGRTGGSRTYLSR